MKNRMETVGITACSNALMPEKRGDVEELVRFLESTGRRVLLSRCIYEQSEGFSGTGQERADELMTLFRNPDVTEIYDVSGGDMANEVLDGLNFDEIRKSRAEFWGYSDLTTVLNAIYAVTGKPGVLFQIRNLVHPDSRELQQRRYLDRAELFTPSFRMVQGDSIRGTVIGGNLRCFLKLAGTRYFPDCRNKILLMEAWSGRIPQMVTYLSQLRSCGVFGKLGGILLGTFTEMEAAGCEPGMLPLVKSFAGSEIPIAVTRDIGHGHDARAIRIGETIEIRRGE